MNTQSATTTIAHEVTVAGGVFWLGKKITQLGIASSTRKLIPLPGEGMLLLADRAYDAGDLMKEVSATGAHFLVRGTATRKPPVGEVLPDGSYLSRIDGLPVRIIEADLEVHGPIRPVPSGPAMPGAVMTCSRAASSAAVKLARSGSVPGTDPVAAVMAMRSAW